MRKNKLKQIKISIENVNPNQQISIKKWEKLSLKEKNKWKPYKFSSYKTIKEETKCEYCEHKITSFKKVPKKNAKILTYAFIEKQDRYLPSY